MRCKLVHNYSEGGKYIFSDDFKYPHFKLLSKGQTVLNLENFIDDIEGAFNKYFIDIYKEKELEERLVNRFKKYGILSYLREEEKNDNVKSCSALPASAAVFDDKEVKYKSLFNNLGRK